MPDPVTHYVFANEVFKDLPDEIKDILDSVVLGRASLGPDPWSYLGFYGGKNKKYSVRSSLLHKTNTGKFLTTLTEGIKDFSSYSAFSFLAGAVCNYCLDKTTHPYIIYKSGYYDGTKETLSQQGGHALMERAIDSYFIRTIYKKKPWRFSIAKNVMPLKSFPKGLKPLIDNVYKEVYGFEDSFNLLNKALKDEKLFYILVQDPLGLFYKITGLLAKRYQVYSYYHKDIDSKKLDYMNLKKEEWNHPNHRETISTLSFLELFDDAKKESVKIITSAYNWIYKNKKISLEDLYGNYNYSTGFDCADERNDSPPVCQPLIFKE